MRWKKKGIIFKTENQFEWMAHHANMSVVDKINEEVLRIYFSPRDPKGLSRVTFIEVQAENPSNVLYLHPKPVLDLGRLGCFDDSGAMTSSLVNAGKLKYLYYHGWNQGVTVPYRGAVGLAVSHDGGSSFERMFDGPIMGRSSVEPYGCGAPFAMIDEGKWKLWYVSGTGWTIVNGKPEPRYQIKYAESYDGINWIRNNITCIDYKFEDEAITRPCVIRANGLYRMWYCYRGSVNYRTDKSQSYRLGYAESTDGIHWIRKDEEVGIDRSDQGWDSKMIEYPFVYEHRGRKYMLYNGNGFGESGLGYAVLEE